MEFCRGIRNERKVEERSEVQWGEFDKGMGKRVIARRDKR